MQVIGRDVSLEVSDLDYLTPKKNAKPANNVRSKQLELSLSFMIFLQEPKATKTKVKDKKMKSVKVLPNIDQR